jgi:hypothetical protein
MKGSAPPLKWQGQDEVVKNDLLLTWQMSLICPIQSLTLDPVGPSGIGPLQVGAVDHFGNLIAWTQNF